ncbi:hypothetical protein UlMin_019786 [Ulmus minor]
MIIYLKWPVIWKQEQEEACEINIETTWMTPIFDYLQNNTLPEDKDTARKIKTISTRFTIIQGNLYRRSFSGPYLTCVNPSQVKTILSEIHEGEFNTLKKRLEGAKGKWADELPSVLWSYRTTSKNSTGATPFSLAFGAEAFIPVEISIPTIRSQFAAEEQNNAMMNFELDTIDEKREAAAARIAYYK